MGRPRKTNGTAKDDLNEAEAAEEARMALDAQREANRQQTITVATNNLVGNLRDLVLNTLRHEQDRRPWDQRSEGDQRETIHKVESALQDGVRQAVELISASGLPTIKATLESVTVKDGLKLVLSMGKFNEQRHSIMDAQGGAVLLVVADADQFMGSEPVPVKPDQRDIEEVLVTHSNDDADAAEDRTHNGVAEDKAGWRPNRDAVPPTSPLN
jgi:hypothetical protein